MMAFVKFDSLVVLTIDDWAMMTSFLACDLQL